MPDEPDLEGRALDDLTELYVPEPIERETTMIIARDLGADPTTLYDPEEQMTAPKRGIFDDVPTVRAIGSQAFKLARVSSVKRRVQPVPARRRAVTPVSLEESYAAAMRALR